MIARLKRLGGHATIERRTHMSSSEDEGAMQRLT